MMIGRLKTRPNHQYHLASYDIPKGEVERMEKRQIVWEVIEMTGRKKVAVVCINRDCLTINIIEYNEVKPDGFVDRGKGNYGTSCIKCKCGTCYWPYLVDWDKRDEKPEVKKKATKRKAKR